MNQLSTVGGYEGLYHTYFQRISEEVEAIQAENEYEKKSHAFAHWFLTNVRGINEDDVSQYITDGFNDWGIDAVIIDEERDLVELYQFKLPDKVTNIEKTIGQTEIESFLRGYKICSSGVAPENANDELKEKISEIVDSDIFNFKLVYVSYTNSLSNHGELVLTTELKQIKDTGNKIYWEMYDKERIANTIYISKKKYETFEIDLVQSGSSTGLLTSENAASYSIHCSLNELADVCLKYQDIIFDENVRLFHGANNKFNSGIIQTATTEDDVINFHLYNNGIVMVSPKVRYIDTRKRLKVTNPMVVNGCQTMNSLLEAKKQGTLQDGFVQVKVIEINDPIIRQNISIFLNSQTEIKDSYLISNLPIVRQLEEDLDKLGYFLERQANKLELLKKQLTKKEKVERFGVNQNKTIGLELAIQLYASVYEDLAPLAKMKKSLLFNDDNLPGILNSLNAERIVFAFKIYSMIMDVIRDYRRCVRNRRKADILQYLGIKAKDLKQYSFLNTADIFLLSLYAHIAQREIGKFDKINNADVKDFAEWSTIAEQNFDSYLKEAVDIIKSTIAEGTNGKSIATLTKSQSFHKRLIAKVHHKG